jgi:hypothetical protein
VAEIVHYLKTAGLREAKRYEQSDCANQAEGGKPVDLCTHRTLPLPRSLALPVGFQIVALERMRTVDAGVARHTFHSLLLRFGHFDILKCGGYGVVGLASASFVRFLPVALFENAS